MYKVTKRSIRNMTGLVAIIALAGCTAPQSTSTTAQEAAAPTTLTTQLTITGGTIKGVASGNGLKEYLAIPYAAPPTGKLRWLPPQPLAPWSGVLDASKMGLPCMQPGSLSAFYDRAYSEMSEDCLTLNIWTRAATPKSKLPVMVWIHGGALVMGSGSDYNGAKLTAKGVVLVTINYRLGPFGFYAHPELSAESDTNSSGNQGYQDQIAALKWVKANIAKFGGDPENVTIFGESAGSWSMSVLQASPKARGLFHKVIGESGARFIPLSELKEEQAYAPSAEAWGQSLAKVIAAQKKPTLQDLRELPATTIINNYAGNPEFLLNFDRLTIVDGEVLPSDLNTLFSQGLQADVPVLIGSNEDEATTFDPGALDPEVAKATNYVEFHNAFVRQTLPLADERIFELYPRPDNATARQSWMEFNTDVAFTQPMRVWANYMNAVSSPAYLYWWNWKPSINGSRHFGSFHAAEVAYVFGDLTMFGIEAAPEDHDFSNLLMDVWTNFAKTGDPSVDGVIDWPAYTSTDQEMVTLGSEINVVRNFRTERVNLITQGFERQRLQ